MLSYIQFLIGAFFTFNLPLVIYYADAVIERDREFAFTILIWSVINAIIAGGMFAGILSKQKGLLTGFLEYRDPWSIGNGDPQITNAGAFLLITLVVNLGVGNFLGF